MPENQLPPSWGPAYDERDLDALLSGELANLPEALMPLAGTLAALHARPAWAELAGEAAARSAFRNLARDPGSWTGEPEPGTVTARTLVLPRPQGDRAQRHTPRHRRPRAGGTVRRSYKIGGIAAAVVLVAGVAVAVLVPGSHLAPFVHHPASQSAAAKGMGTSKASQAPLSKGAKPVPTILPTPGPSSSPGKSPDPGTLCREYFFNHPDSNSAWAAENALRRELDGLAKGHWKVFNYCLGYLDFDFWGSKGTTPTPPHGNDSGTSGNQGTSGNSTGGQAGNSGGQESSGSGNPPAPGATSAATSSSDSSPSPGPGHQSPVHLGVPGNQGTTTRLAG